MGVGRKKLFGTDGVRGVVTRELTPELVLRLSRAIGRFFGKGAQVLVARDTRVAGSLFQNIVVAGLSFEGVRVWVGDVSPTPAVQLYVREHGFDGGVIVTASHNPPEYNGVKVVGPDGIEIGGREEEEIEAIFWEERFTRLDWKDLAAEPRIASDVNEYYVERVVERVDRDTIRRREFKVVVDCGSGATSHTTPSILRRLGAKVLALNCNPDPMFPGREPEPTPSTLVHASRLVAESGADMGIGHDADGDRAIVIDGSGRVHWGDRSGTLLSGFVAVHGLAEGPRRVYTGVSSSMLVEEYLRPLGVEVVWTPVGAPKIARMVKEGRGIAAFEENGGYMHPPHQLVRDGGMKVALLLHMISVERTSLAKAFDRLPKYYPIKTKLRASREQALCAVESVKKAFSEYKLVTIDGVKVLGDGFWILVRPSGTEPVVRIMLEARSEEQARSVLEEVLSIIRGSCRGL